MVRTVRKTNRTDQPAADMTDQPIWSIDDLTERAGSDWPLRARVWAIEELVRREPSRLLELGPALLDPANDPVLREAAASHLARHADRDEATRLTDGLEPSPLLLPLLLRAGDRRGEKIARRMQAWWSWAALNRERFVAWLEGSEPQGSPDLAATIAEYHVLEGIPALAATVLRHDDVALADEIGAYLHLAATGMEGAFADDAGARGVVALQSPFFAMNEEVKLRFQELGTLPPALPRARFAPALRELWGIFFDELGDDAPELYEMMRDVSIATMENEGPDVSEAAVRLANRAVAAAFLRFGIDGAFADAETFEDRQEVWLSFSEAGFRRADELLFAAGGDEGELPDGMADAVVRAFREVTERGLPSAARIAWFVVEHDATGAGEIAAAMLHRALNSTASFDQLVRGEGYREFIAATPEASRALAELGLTCPELSVVRETLRGLENSGSKVAAELISDHFDTLLRRDASPHAARALAVLGSPPHLELIESAWAEGEPTLASFVLSASEIIGREVDPAIGAEGEAAYAETAQTDELDSADIEKTLETMRARFRAILGCTECGRAGRYDVPKMVLDPRGVEIRTITGRVVPNRPITCKFCGAEEQYEVLDETHHYIYPHLIALRTGDEKARVTMTRLELVDETPIKTASQAVAAATALARERNDESAWFDLLRVARIFATDEEFEELAAEAAEASPAAVERFETSPTNRATNEEVAEAFEESARHLERRQRTNRAKAAKVGRYGLVTCWISEGPTTPHIGVAIARKMPRGRLAVGWVAIDREAGGVIQMGANFGVEPGDAEQLLSGWNGPPFEESTPARVGELLGDALGAMVGRGAPLAPDLVVHWPLFESMVK